MAWHLITPLLSLCSNLLPSIRVSADAPSSSSTGNDSSENERQAIEEDLEGLARTLERINATLYDSEESDIRSCYVKHWLKELKEVAYAAEDLLGEYQYEARRVQEEARKASGTSGSNKRKQMECIVPIPHGMVKRLKKIRNRFDEIAKDREAFQLRESDGAKRPNNSILRLPTGHMVDEACIFGRAAEVTKVIDLLLSNKEDPFSVISIIGKGGLGKTTIAQLVYKDGRIRKVFDLYGWVCVFEDFEIRKLIKATIESVCKLNCGLSEMSTLQEKLAKLVKGKSLLLVLDDVWNENQNLWESFFISFKEAELVRFLVTTRNNKVTAVMQATTCFQPRYLPETFCWQLFQQYAFGTTSNFHLVEMGREIMRKCGGLPLAVKSIASLLRHKVDEESWREILESDLWESNSLNDIFPALQISYAHLPAHLKPCLLLCSMYPKGLELNKVNLIELWISHGYIKSSGKKGVTEIGTEYYEELKGRSFLDQVLSEFDYEFCKLHDIIHDLANLNSGGEHYSVDVNQLPNIQQDNVPKETCHLYVKGFTEYVNLILQQNLKGLRSLSVDIRACNGDFEHQYCLNSVEAIDLNIKLSDYYGYCMRNTIIYNLKNFPALRVLELSGDWLTEIPDSITQLKHLSYLNIFSCHLEKLPSSIDLLYNLQTLILNCEESPLKYLPENIGNLVNLRFLYIRIPNLQVFPELPCCLSNLENLHLYTLITLTELPSALGNCCKLKTLTSNNCLNYNPHGLKNFPVIRTMEVFLKVGTLGWLKDMKDLEGEIVIEGLQNMSNLVDAQYANLRSKCKIRTLELSWVLNYYEDPSDWEKNLVLSLQREQPHDDIFVCEDINYDLLERLQPHPRLKKLVLGSYPSPKVPGWMGDPLSLQAIQEIEIASCGNLQSLPFSNLHTLKRFQVTGCHNIRVMQLNQLSTQLEELKILWCGKLQFISGLQDLKMLVALYIGYCSALKSITMDELQWVESSNPCVSSHDKPHEDHQDNTSSLKRLHIETCPLLCAMPHDLVPSGSCKVLIHHCGLPDLEIGDPYESDSEEFF